MAFGINTFLKSTRALITFPFVRLQREDVSASRVVTACSWISTSRSVDDLSATSRRTAQSRSHLGGRTMSRRWQATPLPSVLRARSHQNDWPERRQLHRASLNLRADGSVDLNRDDRFSVQLK